MDIKVFLDMDGVVANMDKAIYDKFGLSFPKTRIPDPDFARLRESIYQGISNDPDFWMEIEPFPGYYEFYRKISSIGDVTVLSAVPRHLSCFCDEAEMCRRQKTEWIRMYFNNELSKNVIVTKAHWKCRYVSKNKYTTSILIDDMEKNIEEWKAAGGVGILHTSFEDTLDRLEKLGFIQKIDDEFNFMMDNI